MSKRILMCPPEHFDIEYEINPWMHVSDPVLPARARAQWQALHDIYTRELGWQVALVPPQPGLPDMVFTANGGLVVGGRLVLPRFRQPERQGETPWFAAWFAQAGYTESLQPRHDFEGEGDALLWNDLLFAGYPWRSDQPAHRELAAWLGVTVVSLQLTDARFYHLDTALTIVDEHTVAVYPPAFTADSLAAIRAHVPQVIEASTADAMAYGLNAMSDGRSIVLSDRATGLIECYRQRGMQVCPTPIDEFQKSGGGVKCLSLELRPPGG
ncbi:MAG: arginine deiminase family protein [Rhodocyclaceae bacterium]|jgi:N-dimethylarginine dimethylaminohydrolase|nr:arginine deiminase family protein [Rhodocyclaceae bacterium]